MWIIFFYYILTTVSRNSGAVFLFFFFLVQGHVLHYKNFDIHYNEGSLWKSFFSLLAAWFKMFINIIFSYLFLKSHIERATWLNWFKIDIFFPAPPSTIYVAPQKFPTCPTLFSYELKWMAWIVLLIRTFYSILKAQCFMFG